MKVAEVNVRHEVQIIPHPRPITALINANSNITMLQRNESHDNSSADSNIGLCTIDTDGEGNKCNHRGKQFEVEALSCTNSSKQPTQDGFDQNGA